MIESQVRVKMQPWFDKLGMFLMHTTPNTITGMAFIFGVCATIGIVFDYRFTALCCLWLSGLCDVLDGTVARLSNTSQKIGAYIDLISDRMVEAALILGFAIAYPEHHFAYLVFMIALLLHFSTFLAAGALFTNTGHKSMHHDHSMVERAEAFVVFSLMLLQPNYIFVILMAFNGLILLDGFLRFYRVVRNN
jgi:phosphatidylglycerophosphate synthase